MEWIASMSTTGGCAAILQLFLSSGFFIQIFATLIGALLAFFFGLMLYTNQKKQENQATLHFFISALTSLSSNLYALKEQIVQHRYKECLECEDIIETSPQPELQIRHMSKYLWWRFWMDNRAGEIRIFGDAWPECNCTFRCIKRLYKDDQRYDYWSKRGYQSLYPW